MAVDTQKLIGAYDGNVGDFVDVSIDPDLFTIKDKNIDIIIV